MPTILERQPYRFYSFSNALQDEPLVYVDRENFSAAFSLKPVKLVWNEGIGREELKKLESFLLKNEMEFIKEAYALSDS